jgi:hypothetical protein
VTDPKERVVKAMEARHADLESFSKQVSQAEDTTINQIDRQFDQIISMIENERRKETLMVKNFFNKQQ